MGQSLDFEFIHEKKCNRAVLLFHGMTGSPFEMKKMGKALFDADFDVFCYCLPGHGTSPINIKTVRWEDWYSDSTFHYRELTQKYEEVYLGGLCMGAVLALAIAAEYRECSHRRVSRLKRKMVTNNFQIAVFLTFLKFGF